MNPMQMQGGAPQGNPAQNLAMFAQMAGAQQPQQMPQGGGQPMMGAGTGAPQGPNMLSQNPPQMPQQMQQPAMSPQMMQSLMQQQMQRQMQLQASRQLPPGASGQPSFTPQELAALGRNGDSVVAHMTPGEIAVPPQVQNPKVLASLRQAFGQHGMTPQQFTAGSGQSPINPNTGMEEHSFWSTALPIALGLAGTAIAPGIGTALGSSLGGASLGAIGGGLGTTLGGLFTGQKPSQAIMSGALGGLGGYYGGQLFSGAGDAAAGASSASGSAAAGGANAASSGAAALNASMSPGQAALLGNAAKSAAAPIATTPSLMNLYGTLPQAMNLNPGALAGSALGSYAGNSMTASPKSSAADANSNLNGAFNTPYTHSDQSWQQLLGQDAYTGPQANFSGYNAADPNSHSWNFYPTSATQAGM